MSMKITKRGGKAAARIFMLALAVFLLASCSSPMLYFPEFLPDAEPDISPGPIQEPAISVDFYIQATPSMRGFVFDGNNNFTQMIELLETPLSQWLVHNREATYYRFDIPGIDTQSSWPFYSITHNEFFADTLTESFYSPNWLLDHADYGRIFENLHGTNAGLDVFRGPFIEHTLRGIRTERLSVIVAIRVA